MTAQELRKTRKSPKKGVWKWVKSHKLPTISIGTVLALVGAWTGYVNTGADSLRTDIYQPLYREIGGMYVAIHSNSMETNYSSDVYETLIRNGSLGRIPKSLRAKIIGLYRAEGEARGFVIPIAHKISILMPQEITKVRTEGDDKLWKEKTISQLNAEAASGLSQGSFPMASFTFNHSGISPSLDLRDKAHPKIASPGTVTWLVGDWMEFPKSASQVADIWRSTFYLGFDEKIERWDYRITHEDLARSHTTLEEFLEPTYKSLASDTEFQQLLRSNQTARDLFEEVKSSLADRVEQPKHLVDLIDIL
jgi:hypothetical protein